MTNTASPAPLPDATRLGRSALRVADLDAMIEFYRTVVGLSVQSRDETRATLGVDDTPLLMLSQDADAVPRTDRQAGLFHNAFRVPSRTALGAALERVRDHWTLEGASDHLVSEALYLSDPEGNGVEIYCDRPREEWPRSDDGTVEMSTLPLDVDAVVSQSDSAADAPAGTDLGHMHLETTSLSAAREFYVETLGLGVQIDSDAALFLAAGDYHHHVGINTWNGRSEPAGGRGLAWFEVVVPSNDALAAVRERLADAGVDVTDRSDGVAIADPDGIGIRLRVE